MTYIRLRSAKCAIHRYYFSLSQGICMIIGGIKHSEQRFNSRSAGVSSSLLFISIGGKMSGVLFVNCASSTSILRVVFCGLFLGVFAPTLFSKAYGNLVCEDCTNSTGTNSTGSFTCRNCYYDLVRCEMTIKIKIK